MLIKSEVLYDAFCEKYQDIVPIFHQPWWLEIVCQFGALQKYVIIGENESVVGILPIFTKYKCGFHWHTCPPFCLYLGSFFLKGYELNNEIVASINRHFKGIYHLFLSISDFNARKMIAQNGFEISEMCYFRIDKSKTLEDIFNGFDKKDRAEIKKATQKYTIVEEFSIDNYLEHYSNHLKDKKIYDEKNVYLFKRLCSSLLDLKQGKLIVSYDPNGAFASGVFVAWDMNRMWPISSTRASGIKNNISTRFLFWYAIQKAISDGRHFDFEGGDIKSIGDFFASFGAEKHIFTRAVRYRNPLIKKTVKLIKNVLYPQHSTFH
jgi:hypothetical protein